MEEIHDLYSSPNVIRTIKSRMRWMEHVPCMGARRRAYAALVGRPEGKRPLGRPRYRWENNSNMDHQEVGLGGMDCINLAQDTDKWQALVNAVMNERVQPIEGNF